MEIRIKKYIFEEKLKFILKRKIEKGLKRKSSYQDIDKYHQKTLNGIINTLTRIVLYSFFDRHYDRNGHFSGHHIYSRDIVSLKRNNLSKYFEFFIRSPDSTYHKNNSSNSESNGYSHWYI